MNEFETKYVTPRKGKTLVVGSRLHGPHRDYRKDFPEALGVDLLAGDGVDLVHDLENPLEGHQFKHIVCHSVLEHVARPWLVAKNIEEVLISRGTIYISVPWAWRFHSYPNDYWRMNHEAMGILFPSIEWHTYGYDLSGQLYVNKLPSRGEQVNGLKYEPRAMLHIFGQKR